MVPDMVRALRHGFVLAEVELQEQHAFLQFNLYSSD